MLILCQIFSFSCNFGQTLCQVIGKHPLVYPGFAMDGHHQTGLDGHAKPFHNHWNIETNGHHKLSINHFDS